MSECQRDDRPRVNFAEFSASEKLDTSVVEVGGTAVDMLGETTSYEVIRRRFQQRVQPTDAIYYYCSKPTAWDELMGSEGYFLVRDGEIIDSVVLRMN